MVPTPQPMASPEDTVRSVSARAVLVPMRRPLRTSTGAIEAAPLLLIDLLTTAGVTGRAYLFGIQPFTLAPLRSLVEALGAGLDMAALDSLARAAGLPLVTLLGGRPGPVRAYNSNGLGIMPTTEAAAEAVELLAAGFDAVKVRLG